MSAKQAATSPRTLAEINKQILEIKKKIQLSEGQRKAAFEEYETERKANADLILKLKKEIAELKVSLQQNKDENAGHRIRSLKLETVVGPLNNKTADQVKNTLDLQIIDLKKNLDLIKHKIKQREAYLAKLAKEYQEMLAEQQKNEVAVKVDNPFKKKACALQNSIHRMEVQWREASHVRSSYHSIRGSLLQDSARFESILQELEDRLQDQHKDIQYLQKINAEAAKTRAEARGSLEREERNAMNSSKIRDKQNADYQRMVAERKLELERLERRIFQTGKVAPPRPDTAEDTEPTEISTPEEDQELILKMSFDKLKDATGATSTKEVLSRFQAQRDTRNRLDYLKKTTEAEKSQLVIKQDALNTELEMYKYAQERDKEKNSEGIIKLKEMIEKKQERTLELEEKYVETESLFETLCNALYRLYLGLKEVGVTTSKEITAKTEESEKLVGTLHEELQGLLEREVEKEEEKEPEEEESSPSEEETLMPPSYSALLRRTPLPVHGHTVIAAPPILSEDEEEVPSRGFLKRQAQIVVDAKSRRSKNIRVPIARK